MFLFLLCIGAGANRNKKRNNNSNKAKGSNNINNSNQKREADEAIPLDAATAAPTESPQQQQPIAVGSTVTIGESPRRLAPKPRPLPRHQQQQHHQQQQPLEQSVEFGTPRHHANGNVALNNNNSDKDRKIRSVAKKLSDIKKLKSRQSQGLTLELNQLNKIEMEARYLEELKALKLSV